MPVLTAFKSNLWLIRKKKRWRAPGVSGAGKTDIRQTALDAKRWHDRKGTSDEGVSAHLKIFIIQQRAVLAQTVPINKHAQRSIMYQVPFAVKRHAFTDTSPVKVFHLILPQHHGQRLDLCIPSHCHDITLLVFVAVIVIALGVQYSKASQMYKTL